MRAHTYYRSAEFFLPADDDRRIPAYERSRETFRTAIEHLPTPVEITSIPFEDTTLPGYLFLPDDTAGASEPVSVIVCVGGFDSLGEELYFICGVPEALARGYAVFLFDGPGQGAPLRYEGMTARRDWEHVVERVIDFLDDRDEVDSDGVGLIGVSMGGYYAPRAAAFEKRIGACCVFDHQHDVLLSAADGNPRMAQIARRIPDGILEPLVGAGGRISVEARWLIQQGKWVFGVESVGELIDAFASFSVTDVAGNIECPMLILAGENDHLVPVAMAE